MKAKHVLPANCFASALFLAACSGGHGNGNSSMPPLAQSGANASSDAHGHMSPTAGVTARDLAHWAANQLSMDQQRRAGRGTSSEAGRSSLSSVRMESSSLQSSTISGLGSGSALVLYDTAGQWGYLGELYAIATGNLASHFGTVTFEPISAYTAGQIATFTATFYIGSTYYSGGTGDGIPAAFYTDVASSSRPVTWVGDNIWNFANAVGPANFEAQYGWDPTNSYFAPNGSVGNVTQVSYKGQTLTRSIPAGADGGILHPSILGGTFPAVQVLATAIDSSTSPATTFPWAIRSGNLTYIGEIPFAYVNESDRVLAYEDLFFDALAPATAPRHLAMVRLEDLNATDNMTQLQNVATWLFNNKTPYGFNVIPFYTDPNGHYNHGVPQSITLAQAPAFVKVIKYMLTHGGTMIDEGYSHQYSTINNPYDAVSGDDAEFYLAHITSTNSVQWDGPIPGDSSAFAQTAINNAKSAFASVGLPFPTLWVTPHYFASDIDYRVFASNFVARYERGLYFGGAISGAPPTYANLIGEFYPYIVRDVYGAKVIPENLGDYEPVSLNNNPIRLPADLINEAKLNLVVRDGFASFFYDPSYGSSVLSQIVGGIRQNGYTFVSAANQ